MSPAFAIGTRVRVKSLSHTLRDAGAPAPLTGTVSGHDVLGYCLVELDRPVEYQPLPGVTEVLGGIRADAENLAPLGFDERGRR